MNRFGSKARKAALLLALPPLLFLSGITQRQMNLQRVNMGITRGVPLGQAAPPVLAFTTVALGGFRGLIANALWIRAMELQDEDKYFEKVQLTDWITKLQPRIVTVWVVQAWDMAYNISIKFSDPRDRWRWVERGISLLRDEALKYNPDEPLIYRELGWIFQHKIGRELDDAHLFFKEQWAREMAAVLQTTNYMALIDPQTDDEKERARILREKYKLDPLHMKQVDEEYGPLEWRLPETHAIYWATLALQRAKQQEQITLRREIYQPLQLAFQRGRLIEIVVGTNKTYRTAPNLALIPNANKGYEKMMAEDAEYRAHIATAHKNFLKDAVYFLYTSNRRADAQHWFDYLLSNYPDVQVLDERDPSNSTPNVADMTLDEYCVVRATDLLDDTSQVKIQLDIEGFLLTSYANLATGATDEAAGYLLLANKVWTWYQEKTSGQRERLELPSMELLKEEALNQFRRDYHPVLVEQLYNKLGRPLPAETPPSSPPTNAPAGVP